MVNKVTDLKRAALYQTQTWGPGSCALLPFYFTFYDVLLYGCTDEQ